MSKTQIHLRIKGDLERKRRWLKAAKGKPLEQWAGEQLDAAAHAQAVWAEVDFPSRREHGTI